MFIDYISIDWDSLEGDSYLSRIGALCSLRTLRFHSPVTFFVGENGSGKSTLLEAIAVAYGFNPEGGTRNYRFSTFDDHSPLWKAVTVGRGAHARGGGGFFLRAESFFNLSTQAAEYEKEVGPLYGERTLHEYSHGESFMQFISSFRGRGLYLMDEPEAALSTQRQMSLFAQIDRMAKDGSQYIIVTHSPILLALPGAEILCFKDGGIVPQKYEETDSYLITESFINRRDLMVRTLTGEE